MVFVLIALMTGDFAVARVQVVERARPIAGPELAGEDFYLTGASAGLAPVSATVQGDLRVQSTEMPCANCHRRSGWAGTEGALAVPPVTAPALFSPVTRGGVEMGTLRTTGVGTRPAYTDETLLRAIREGVDPTGRVLSPTMPRYALGTAHGAALVAHLRSLSAEPTPGVMSSALHLATIVTSDVSARDRDALLSVLRAYVRDKNAGTRQESRRRERGPWDMKQHYDGYREWVLHEWALEGPPAEWSAQLAALYERQPVYGVVGGVTNENWSPVHEFAELRRLPVILPQTPLPASRPPQESFYTLYYSRGVSLEADTLVDRLLETPPSRIVQVSRCGSPGQAAAEATSRKVARAVPVTNRCVEPGVPLTAEVWPSALPADAVLALWLNAVDTDALATTLPPSTGPVYLSSTLVGEVAPGWLSALGNRASFLHPFVPPDELERHAIRALAWLKAKGLASHARRVAINTFHVATLTADALAHPRALDSRELFIERVEAMATRSPSRSAYPETLFSAQRRFASAGCYVLQGSSSDDGVYKKVGEWRVPR